MNVAESGNLEKFILQLQRTIASPNTESLDVEEQKREQYYTPSFTAIETLLVSNRLTPVYRKTLTIDVGQWLVIINGHAFEVVCGKTIVPSYSLFVSIKGLPVALITPFKVRILGEAELFYQFESEVSTKSNLLNL
jgi:hypothetical protein